MKQNEKTFCRNTVAYSTGAWLVGTKPGPRPGTGHPGTLRRSSLRISHPASQAFKVTGTFFRRSTRMLKLPLDLLLHHLPDRGAIG